MAWKTLTSRVSCSRRRTLCCYWTIIFTILSGSLVLEYYYEIIGFRNTNYNANATDPVLTDLSYFQSTLNASKKSFLVDNEKCKIPDICIWDPDVHSLIQRPAPIRCDQPHLTYVKYQSIVVDEDVLRDMGYHIFEDISCCYHNIMRGQQPEDNFDHDADNNFIYSEQCYSMGRITQPLFSLVVVFCKADTIFGRKTIYKNFHWIAQFPKRKNDFYYLENNGFNSGIIKKLEYWGEKSKMGGNRPPNVLMLGIDSTSRINFHRYMPLTRDFLVSRLGAVEMKGYTKVGENTLPNMVAISSSLTLGELRKICYTDAWTPQDKCPYIWKEYSKRNYLTIHIDDAPKMAIFNYYTTGFIRPPVDIYPRAWMLAAYNDTKKDPDVKIK